MVGAVSRRSSAAPVLRTEAACESARCRRLLSSPAPRVDSRHAPRSFRSMKGRAGGCGRPGGDLSRLRLESPEGGRPAPDPQDASSDGLHRPPLSHVGVVRLPGVAGVGGAGGGERGASRTWRSPTTTRSTGALRGRDAAPDGLTVIVGEEVKTADGDLIALFLERAVPPGRSAARHDRGGPGAGRPRRASRTRSTDTAGRCSRTRASRPSASSWTGSRRTTPGSWAATATSGRRPSRASSGCPGVAASDAHSVLEVGVAYNVAGGRPVHARRGCWPPCGPFEIVTGRASYIVRTLTPISKLVNRARGNTRVPWASAEAAGRRLMEPPVTRARSRRPQRPTSPARSPRRRRWTPSRWEGASGSRGPSSRSSSRSCSWCWCSSWRSSWTSPTLVQGVQQANKLWLLVAFVVFYAGFPLRGFRWSRILAATRFRIDTRDAPEILFLSWLVNCLVPAKLGDVYRAYLLKLNAPAASLSRTFGTVFIERLLDIFAIAVLGLAAGFWSFRNGLPAGDPVRHGAGHRRRGRARRAAALAAQLRARPSWSASTCPSASSSCTTSSRRACSAPSARASCRSSWCSPRMIWATEGFRLFFVVKALGLPGRGARAVGRLLRGADRLAADRRSAEPGRPRDRGAGRRVRAHHGVRRAERPRPRPS